MGWGVRAFPAGPLTLLLSDSLQAGLDKMSKGHMLADVVAIIGTRPTVSCGCPSPGLGLVEDRT